jgi:hypothetical protein
MEEANVKWHGYGEFSFLAINGTKLVRQEVEPLEEGGRGTVVWLKVVTQPDEGMIRGYEGIDDMTLARYYEDTYQAWYEAEQKRFQAEAHAALLEAIKKVAEGDDKPFAPPNNYN